MACRPTANSIERLTYLISFNKDKRFFSLLSIRGEHVAKVSLATINILSLTPFELLAIMPNPTPGKI